MQLDIFATVTYSSHICWLTDGELIYFQLQMVELVSW